MFGGSVYRFLFKRLRLQEAKHMRLLTAPAPRPCFFPRIFEFSFECMYNDFLSNCYYELGYIIYNYNDHCMLYPIQDFDGIKKNFIKQKNETMFVDIN